MHSNRYFLALAVLLSGCVSLPEAQRLDAFRLGAADPLPMAAQEPARSIAVAVEQPLAQGALATDRIVVVVDGRLQVVSGARWDERAPEMLNRQIARALQSAGGIDVVDAAQRGGRADFALLTVLERMQVAIGRDGSGEALTEIATRLVRFPERDIVATAFFAGTAPAADDNPATLAKAIDSATAVALADLVAWVNTSVRRAPRR
jgi:cholesterol transport system auxiliary component